MNRLVEEVEEDIHDTHDYKSMVKARCFICHASCNEKLDFTYYCVHGNTCLDCMRRINNKMQPKKTIDIYTALKNQKASHV